MASARIDRHARRIHGRYFRTSIISIRPESLPSPPEHEHNNNESGGGKRCGGGFHCSFFVFCFVVVKGAPSPSVHALLPCAVALTRLFDSGHLADVQPVAPTQ